jgi:hypothetical protein
MSALGAIAAGHGGILSTRRVSVCDHWTLPFLCAPVRQVAFPVRLTPGARPIWTRQAPDVSPTCGPVAALPPPCTAPVAAPPRGQQGPTQAWQGSSLPLAACRLLLACRTAANGGSTCRRYQQALSVVPVKPGRCMSRKLYFVSQTHLVTRHNLIFAGPTARRLGWDVKERCFSAVNYLTRPAL